MAEAAREQPKILSFHSTHQICIRTLMPSTSMVFILKSTPGGQKRAGKLGRTPAEN